MINEKNLYGTVEYSYSYAVNNTLAIVADIPGFQKEFEKKTDILDGYGIYCNQKMSNGQLRLSVQLVLKPNFGIETMPSGRFNISYQKVGKQLVIVLNFVEGDSDGDIDAPTEAILKFIEGIDPEVEYYIHKYCIFNFNFSAEETKWLLGKEVLLLSVVGDPEEGEITKVIVEDEDEID